MATYAMLSTVGPGGGATIREHPDRILEVQREVEALGVTVLSQYALLGQYDFLTIIEAPDERAMARVATHLAARGTLRTTTLQAIPAAEFVAELARDV